MFRAVRRFFALALLALWLPATAHCSIKAATGWFAELCDIACSHAENTAHADACDVVESGDFTAAAINAHAPAPSLTTLACLARIHARLLAEAIPLATPAWSKDDPDDWVPSWSFAFRAALPARAPDLS